MKEVYTARDRFEAQMVCDMLLREEIRAIVRGEHLAGIPVGSCFPSVWVKNNDDFSTARQLVEAFLRQREEERKSPPTWVCPECGETVEKQFARCWQCQTARPVDE